MYLNFSVYFLPQKTRVVQGWTPELPEFGTTGYQKIPGWVVSVRASGVKLNHCAYSVDVHLYIQNTVKT